METNHVYYFKLLTKSKSWSKPSELAIFTIDQTGTPRRYPDVAITKSSRGNDFEVLSEMTGVPPADCEQDMINPKDGRPIRVHEIYNYFV